MMAVKFTHIRVFGNPTPEDEKIGRDYSFYPCGGATIAWDDHPSKPDSVRVSVARCNENDNFCKRIGRDIALGRLTDGNYWTIAVENRNNSKETESAVVTWFNNEYLPLVTPYHLLQTEESDA